MAKILLIEDDVLLGQGLQQFLIAHEYECIWKNNMSDIEHHWLTADLVILDRQLPEGDSIHFLPFWLMKKAVAVIFLTARIDIHERVKGLEAGARDYIIKPFSNQELLARIHAQLRPLGESYLTYKNIMVNLATHDVSCQQTIIFLKPKEFKLLVFLIKNKNRVFHRDELLNQVWGYKSFPSTRTVDNHILHLRQKLPTLNVETIRSVGYRLKI